MVGTIIPMGHGERRTGRRQLVPIVFVVSLVAGGSLVGLAPSVLGGFIRNTTAGAAFTNQGIAVIVGSFWIVYGIGDVGRLHLPRPRTRRQVPSTWRYRFPPRFTAAAYGVLLGLGIGTFLPTSALYLVLIYLLFVPWPAAMALGALFGLGRGLPIILIAVFRLSEPSVTDPVGRLGPWQAVGPAIVGLMTIFVGASIAGGAVIRQLGG